MMLAEWVGILVAAFLGGIAGTAIYDIYHKKSIDRERIQKESV